MKPALSLSGGQTGGWPDGLPAWQQTGRQTGIIEFSRISYELQPAPIPRGATSYLPQPAPIPRPREGSHELFKIPLHSFPHQSEGLAHLVFNGFDGDAQFVGDFPVAQLLKAAQYKDLPAAGWQALDGVEDLFV